MRVAFIFIFLFAISFSVAENLSADDAYVLLADSESIIAELSTNGFYVSNIVDLLSDANLTFKQAKYAYILRNNSLSDSDPSKIEAKNALALVNWKNLTYNEITFYTDQIKNYREDSYFIYDSLTSLSKKIGSYDNVNFSASVKLLRLANESFYKGQVSESLIYIEQAKAQIETDLESVSSLNVLAKNAKNFVVRYFYWIILVIIFLIFLGYFIVQAIRIKLLKKTISKLEIEEKVLDGLMKKTQYERYKENKISGLIYNIRMKKYQERLSEIKKDLPVLKARLNQKRR